MVCSCPSLFWLMTCITFCCWKAFSSTLSMAHTHRMGIEERTCNNSATNHRVDSNKDRPKRMQETSLANFKDKKNPHCNWYCNMLLKQTSLEIFSQQKKEGRLHWQQRKPVSVNPPIISSLIMERSNKMDRVQSTVCKLIWNVIRNIPSLQIMLPYIKTS